MNFTKKIKYSSILDNSCIFNKELSFKKGILGFEYLKKFNLLKKDLEYIFYLRSVENPSIGFYVIDPFLIDVNYKLDISHDDFSDLGIVVENSDSFNIALLSIITVPNNKPIQYTTANLMGPIIINFSNLYGIQAISRQPQYQTKHFVFSSNNENKLQAM